MALKEGTAAVVTLRRPGNWTKQGRKNIAKWLHQVANDLSFFGDKYSTTGDTRKTYNYTKGK